MLFSIIGIVCGLELIFLSISLYFYLKFRTYSIQANPSSNNQEENQLLQSNGTPCDQQKNFGKANQDQMIENQQNESPKAKRNSSQNIDSNNHLCGPKKQMNSQDSQNKTVDSQHGQYSNNQGKIQNCNQIEQEISEMNKDEKINQLKFNSCHQNQKYKKPEIKCQDNNHQSNNNIQEDEGLDQIEVEEKKVGNNQNKQKDQQENNKVINNEHENRECLEVSKKGLQEKSQQQMKENTKNQEQIIIFDDDTENIVGYQTNQQQIIDFSKIQEQNQRAQQSDFEKKEKQQDLQKPKDHGENNQHQKFSHIQSNQLSSKMENKEDNSSIEKQNDNQQTPLQTQLASVQSNQNQQTISTNQTSDKELLKIQVKELKSPQQQKIIQNYECIQIIYLLIACSIFVQAVKTRIFLKQKPEKRNYPYFCEQGVYSGLISLVIVNLLYCVPFEKIFKSTPPQFRIISRLSLIIYGFTMVFPIYSGLDKFLDLEFISIFVSFTFSLIVQLALEKCISKCYKFPLTKLKSTKISTIEQINCE